MTNNKKSKRAHRKHKADSKLKAMFKMSKEELATRKMTGGGIHRTDPRFVPRSQQRRQIVKDNADFIEL